MTAHTQPFLLSWVQLIYMWSAEQLGIVKYHTLWSNAGGRVTHPCINWTHDCFTSVISHKTFTLCYVSPQFCLNIFMWNILEAILYQQRYVHINSNILSTWCSKHFIFYWSIVCHYTQGTAISCPKKWALIFYAHRTDMTAHTQPFLLSWVQLIYMWSAEQLGIVKYHTLWSNAGGRVTHPCINWTHDCFTSVISHKTFTLCYVSPQFV